MVWFDSPINGLSSGVYENSWRGTPEAVYSKNNEKKGGGADLENFRNFLLLLANERP